jgi:hypothetical protein
MEVEGAHDGAGGDGQASENRGQGAAETIHLVQLLSRVLDLAEDLDLVDPDELGGDGDQGP